MTWLALPPVLAWVPFLNPIALPAGARLWMFLPLAFCIALVYRATRARTARELPWPTVINFVQIVVAMVLIAVGFYALHALVLWFS
ncbi:MAG: hypothetical protein IH986_13890 [Planctomycetes bacterium]|nr:hypothetical protein [Planctomycetota bacterium]